jgi:hypothetical protein
MKCRLTGMDMDLTFWHSLKKNKIINEMYEEEMLSKNPEAYKAYVESNKHINFLKKWIKGEGINCKITGKLIPVEKIISTPNTNLYYSDVETRIARGSSFRGKKRPEFAKKISSILKGRPKTDEDKKQSSDRLKSIGFKKKVLLNKSIIDELCNDEIKIRELYKKMYSDLQKGIEYKRRFVIKNINKYIEDFNGSLDYLAFAPEDEIRIIFSELQSIKSSIAMRDNPTMGNAKVVLMTDLKHNNNGLVEVKVRSVMESEIIKMFERYGVKWEYETETIEYFYLFNRKYTVDFKFYYNDKIYYLEVKGSVRSTDHDKIVTKAEFAVKKFDNYIFYQKELILNIDDLIKYRLTPDDKIKIKHLYEVK